MMVTQLSVKYPLISLNIYIMRNINLQVIFANTYCICDFRKKKHLEYFNFVDMTARGVTRTS